MPVQTREALQTLQKFFTRRSADAPNVDAFNVVPQLVIPIDRTFDQVQPGKHTSAALGAGDRKFTWPAVPIDEAHLYENISFTHDSGTGLDVALMVQGKQAGTSWARVYAEWDGIVAGERVDLLAGYNDGGGGTPSWNSGGPLRIYSGEELVVRFLLGATVGTIVRFDWLRRVVPSPFTFLVENDAVVLT